MKKIAFLLFASILLFACKDKPTVEEVKEFTVTNKVINLRLSSQGEAILYTPKAAYKQVEWTSGDTKVANVDAVSGYVTPVGKGTATVTGTLKNGFKQEVTVNVSTDQEYYTNPENTKFYEMVLLKGSYDPYYYPFKYRDKETGELKPLTLGYVSGDPNHAQANALIDTVQSLKWMVLNTDCYWGADGPAGEGGPAFEINSSAWWCADAKVIFALGDYEVADLDTVIPKYAKYWDEKKQDSLEFPFIPPMYIPKTKFDKDMYTEFTQLTLLTEGDNKPNKDNFPYNGHSYTGRKDRLATEVLCFWPQPDFMGVWTWGTLEEGVFRVMNDPQDDRKTVLDGYHLVGKFFGGTDLTGFKTEYRTPETHPGTEKPGNYYVIEGESGEEHYVFDEMVSYEFIKEPSQQVEGKMVKGMSIDAFNKVTMINEALYLPLIQKMSSDNSKLSIAR